MKSTILIQLIVCIVLFSFRGQAQTHFTSKTHGYDYYWARIDSLETAGLPRTALIEVENVYAMAKNEKNTGQLLKSLIFKMKFNYAVEPDNYAQQIVALEDDLQKMGFPDSAVAHSMLGEMYWNYFTQNRYRFFDRTKTLDFAPTDLQTWSLGQILEKSREHYLSSIQQKELLFEIVADSVLHEITEKGYPESFQFKTVFDFLAFRAIDFLKSDEVLLQDFAPSFKMDDERFFATAGTFLEIDLHRSEPPSNTMLVLRIFQELLEKHRHENDVREFLLADLYRLKFISEKSIHVKKEGLYIEALENLAQECKDVVDVWGEVKFQLAKAIYGRGDSYEKGTNEKHRWDYKTAKDICTEILAKSGIDDFTAENCRALISSITQKHIAVTTEDVLIPGEASPALVSFRNIDSVYVRIIKTTYGEFDSLQQRVNRMVNRNERETYQMIMADTLRKMQPIKSFSIQLPKTSDYRGHSVEIVLPALPTGQYVYLFSVGPSFSYAENAVAFDFKSVSNISFINRPDKKGGQEYMLMQRQTGKPLRGVKVNAMFVEYDYRIRKTKVDQSETLLTDKEGSVKIRPNGNNTSLIVEFKNGDDILSTKNYGNPFDRGQFIGRNRDRKDWQTQTVLFIDRGIYRPGQTLHFKGIVYKTDFEKKHEIVTGYLTTITLNDVNGQKVSDLTVMTNEYGTFSGSFVLPQGGLNGQMWLHEIHGQKFFHVEEYKRPTFEVELAKTTGSPKIGEEILVAGFAKAFTGAPIDGAKVKYNIVRNARYQPWYYRPQRGIPVPIASGETTTNGKGGFEFTFNATPDYSDNPQQQPIYNFTVSIDITDINGETRSANKTITIGYNALILAADFPEMADKNLLDSVSISTKNLEGEFEPAKGKITIYKLQAPQQTYRDRYWEMPDTFIYTERDFHSKLPQNLYRDENDFLTWEKGEIVQQDKFDTGVSKNIELQQPEKWSSGKYMAELVATDKYGTEVNSKSYFTLYANDEKNVPFAKTDFFDLDRNEAKPGDTIQLFAGTSEKEINVLFELEQNGEILKKEWLSIKNSLQKIDIPIKEEYSGNVILNYVFIKNGRLYNHSEIISVPYSQKEITIKIETFRDKLSPGEKEQWRLKLSGNDGEKLAAEMVATMYDASLDQFGANTFDFNVNRFWWPMLRWSSQKGFAPSRTQIIEKNWNETIPTKEKQLDNIQWFGFNFNAGYGTYLKAAGVADGSIMIRGNSSVQSETLSLMSKAESFDQEVSFAVEQGLNQPTLPEPLTTVPVRKNLNETAFFYPHLLTNEEGEIIINFTVPEALTKWKMLGFAHTRDLRTGFIEKTLVTSKDLMVAPNLPRFLREGDSVVLTSKIVNLSDRKLDGQAQLMLFDALSMNPVDSSFNNSSPMKSFQVEAGQSTLVNWEIEIPAGMQAVACRVVAQSGSFTDGEEKVVPVLTNRILVTETLPLWVKQGQTKSFTLDKLVNSTSGTRTNHALTFEFTANPAWYAIQALPFMMEYPYECMEQTFSRFYANAIATSVINSSPKIKRVFDAWKSENNGEAFLSKLEQNQELKTVLLEETPWVLDAQNETERNKRIALLFDLNKMGNEQKKAIEKLKQGQYPSGGWPWFEGGKENRYITQHIVSGLGHLLKINVLNAETDNEIWQMLEKAIGYLDNELLTEYNNLTAKLKKAEMDKNHLSNIAVHYLYGRSFFKDIPLPTDAAEAADYFKVQAATFWTDQNNYIKGLIALALFRDGQKDAPLKIVKSLKEHATHSDEMGMFWKTQWGYYWHQSPVETQALMIELFDEVAQDKTALDELRVWLLKNKQTNGWKTTKATAEACYALLLGGTDWLATENKVTFEIGGKKFEPENDETLNIQAGTGYFKKVWRQNEITPEMGKVTMWKPDPGISWGGLYWQYFEQLDKITSANTPLSIEKKLFKEVQTSGAKAIEPVDEAHKLLVGDKVIVRMILRADRNMEFVHLKDMRASCFEPVNVLSGYRYQDGLGYYQSTKDASMNFFIDHLPVGTYVFEYPLWVSHTGDFSNGITIAQSMYAPEFSSHSEGARVEVRGE